MVLCLFFRRSTPMEFRRSRFVYRLPIHQLSSQKNEKKHYWKQRKEKVIAPIILEFHYQGIGNFSVCLGTGIFSRFRDMLATLFEKKCKTMTEEINAVQKLQEKLVPTGNLSRTTSESGSFEAIRKLLDLLRKKTESRELHWQITGPSFDRVYTTNPGGDMNISLRKYFIESEDQIGADPILWGIEFGTFRLLFCLGTECGEILEDIVHLIHSIESPVGYYSHTDDPLNIYERLKLKFKGTASNAGSK